MKVVLTEDVKKIGKRGDTVDVADGYGRNYLIPKGLAVPASKGVLKNVSLIREGQAKKDAQQEQAARDLAARLEGVTAVVKAKGGEGGKLYGAVTSRDIAAALEKKISQKVDRRKIELGEPIKTPGTHRVLIRLYPGVQAEVTVEVEIDTN